MAVSYEDAPCEGASTLIPMESLRSELRQTLESELAQQSKKLQTHVRADVQEMLVELHQKLLEHISASRMNASASGWKKASASGWRPSASASRFNPSVSGMSFRPDGKGAWEPFFDIDEECAENYTGVELRDTACEGASAPASPLTAAALLLHMKCPAGHALTAFPVNRDRSCDKCRKEIPKGAVVHSCRDCDFDECANCYAGLAQPVHTRIPHWGSTPKAKPHLYGAPMGKPHGDVCVLSAQNPEPLGCAPQCRDAWTLTDITGISPPSWELLVKKVDEPSLPNGNKNHTKDAPELITKDDALDEELDNAMPLTLEEDHPPPLRKSHSKVHFPFDNSPSVSTNTPKSGVSGISRQKSMKLAHPRSTTGVIGTAKMRHRGSALMSDLISPQSLQSKAIRLCSHSFFDYAVAIVIVLNGILVGVQCDYMAREVLEDPPTSFEVLEMLFCVLFTTELGLRLFAYRCSFFTMSGWGWNVFDFAIVILQLVEIFLGVLAAGIGFNFNVLRVLRVLRIVRLARTLRLIGELRTIVSSIMNSMRPLFWTAVLLFMMVYVLGIFLTQAVHTKRISLVSDGKTVPSSLDMYYSSLPTSIFSLFEAITGGVDWDQVCRPLMEHIGPEIAIVFAAYILFTVLAMLNVVTGVFIESVMTHANEEKEQQQKEKAQALFRKLDMDNSGNVTWEDFEKHLANKEMREFFKAINVDIDKARSLFDLLDMNETGTVDVGEFMDGCLRIWSPAKGLDLRIILRDVNRVAMMLAEMSGDGCESSALGFSSSPLSFSTSPANSRRAMLGRGASSASRISGARPRIPSL